MDKFHEIFVGVNCGSEAVLLWWHCNIRSCHIFTQLAIWRVTFGITAIYVGSVLEQVVIDFQRIRQGSTLFVYYSSKLRTGGEVCCLRLPCCYFFVLWSALLSIFRLSVCLSVCPLAYFKFHEIFYACYLSPCLSPPLTTVKYLFI